MNLENRRERRGRKKVWAQNRFLEAGLWSAWLMCSSWRRSAGFASRWGPDSWLEPVRVAIHQHPSRRRFLPRGHAAGRVVFLLDQRSGGGETGETSVGFSGLFGGKDGEG